MIALFLTLAGVGLLVFLGEYLRHVHLLHTEVTRKFIHITVASFAAVWPFYMEWKQIQLISLLMFVGIVVSRGMHLFRAIHGVQRRTWGELFFAMSIGVCAVLAGSPWIFAAGMLAMGLADGMAALAGTLFNGKRYKVFGHHKSVRGTVTFYVTTLLILAACSLGGNIPVGLAGIIFLPLVAAVFENIAVAGTDNLFVPLAIILGVYMF
jgi:phytol kinase